VLIIGCNTAHYFHPMVEAAVSVPVLHMPRETAKVIKAQGYTSACILGTDMTFRTGLYHRALEAEGITPMGLDEEGQQVVLDLIYKGVKAGNAAYPVEPSLTRMRACAEQGAQCFILGCTELPIAFAGMDTGLTLIDPTDILARAAVKACGYEVNE
jgi:aspartate racemase